MLISFSEELELIEKEAAINMAALRSAGKAIGGALSHIPGAKTIGAQFSPKTWQEAGTRLLHPVQSIRKGWQEMAPGAVGALKHTKGDAAVTRLAKNLGQRGWTGAGKFTKYLPVGQKGLTVGLSGAFAAPAISNAIKQKPTPTGEGGIGEVGLREGLGMGAMIAGGGLPILPAIALWSAGSRLGSGAGRIIDRLRGGANLDTAVNAPSEQEANEQLENIMRYHG